MHRFAAICLLLCPTVAAAQLAPDTARAKAERDLFEKVIEIPTVAGRGEMPRLVKLLASEFRKAGISDIHVKPHGDTQTLIARWPAERASGKKPILLLAHMDVVEAKASDWTHDPFQFREVDGHYVGRGTLDNKQGVVAIVVSLARLKASGFAPARDIVVLLTGDEETQQDGARLATSDWRSLIDAEYALNMDAGGGSLYRDGRAQSFSIQIAEKTYADFRFVATNRGGHSSAPRPENAIYRLSGALKNLEEYRFAPMINEATRAFFEGIAEQDKGAQGASVRAWLDDPSNLDRADRIEYLMPGLTRTRCVATQLSAGHAPNALPQKAEANVNCRIFPGVKPDDVRQELQAIAGKEVKVEPVKAAVWSDPSPLREDVVGAFRAAIHKRFPGAPVIPSMSAFGTDAVHTRAAGIPTYGVGTAWVWATEPSGVHGLNERIPIKSFHDQIDMLEEMLRDLAG